ncbi:hypothetical protein BSL78_28589 [Apostichopus japonicus]|uniref:Uncharacterized protein n=1 Tax=Stichopus japonicus TaxID=307972 RepID=A0A2G8JFS4_STIJA|nr:hypothetical protein BSL78_28589 [Apostichopus japonicus]
MSLWPRVNERKTWMDLIGSAQDNTIVVIRKETNRMNLPQRPDYHLNELDVEKNKDANVHPPAERAETTKVIVKTPEVVTRAAVPFNNTTPDEQGDATTLLKTALEEKISNEADIRKTSQHIRLLLSRAQRVIKEKSSEPLVASTLDRISEQFQRVQKLHEGEVRSLEYDLQSEETAKVNQQKEVKRLKAMLYELQNSGESPPPTNYSVEAIVTDLDHNDTDPESKPKKNRLSYSADSNSSATDESDGNDHHDYEDITEGRDPVTTVPTAEIVPRIPCSRRYTACEPRWRQKSRTLKFTTCRTVAVTRMEIDYLLLSTRKRRVGHLVFRKKVH